MLVADPATWERGTFSDNTRERNWGGAQSWGVHSVFRAERRLFWGGLSGFRSSKPLGVGSFPREAWKSFGGLRVASVFRAEREIIVWGEVKHFPRGARIVVGGSRVVRAVRGKTTGVKCFPRGARNWLGGLLFSALRTFWGG